MAWWGHSVSKGEWIYTHLVDIKLLTLRPLLFGTQMSGTQGSLNGPGGRQPGTLTSKPLNQPCDCGRVWWAVQTVLLCGDFLPAGAISSEQVRC